MATTSEYRETKASIDKWNAVIWRRIAVVGIIGLAVLGGALAYVVTEVGAIRSTQIQNIKVNTCQSQAVNGLLKDVPLAFSGDKNPKDYSKVPTGCPLP